MLRKNRSKRTQPFKNPVALGISTHIATGPLGFGATLDLNVYPKGALHLIEIQQPMADPAVVVGVDNGGGSRITLLDRGDENQQFHASGASTQTPEHEDDATSECFPPWLSKPVLITLIVLKVRERERGAPSNTPNEYESEDQGTVAERSRRECSLTTQTFINIYR